MERCGQRPPFVISRLVRRASNVPASAESRTCEGLTWIGPLAMVFGALPPPVSNLLIRQLFTSMPTANTAMPAARERATGPKTERTLRGVGITVTEEGGSQ